MVNPRDIAGERKKKKKKKTNTKKTQLTNIQSCNSETLTSREDWGLTTDQTGDTEGSRQPGSGDVCCLLGCLTSQQHASVSLYLLTYAHRSQWSIGHQRPPSIALCSGLLLSFRTSWSPAVSARLQCLASNCCEAGLSSSSLAGSRSGLGVWCWMLAS